MSTQELMNQSNTPKDEEPKEGIADARIMAYSSPQTPKCQFCGFRLDLKIHQIRALGAYHAHDCPNRDPGVTNSLRFWRPKSFKI